jgi:uncharacterized protein
MMCVPTELRMSPIHGIGVYLLKPVKKGNLIWRFDSRIDRVYTESEIASLPEIMQQYIKMYSCFEQQSGVWVSYGDNSRHINHSDTPNLESLSIAFGDDVALVDIPAGTELTSDYNTICDISRTTGKV